MAQSSCSDNGAALSAASTSFAQHFFSCYSSNATLVGSCLKSDLGLSGTTCAEVCLASVASCVGASCSSTCISAPYPASCTTCAVQNCDAVLQACTGTGLSFNPCTSFLCNQPAWVLPVIIAGSIVGFIVLVLLGVAIVRRRQSDDDGGMCSMCGNVCCIACAHRCEDAEDARFEREQAKRDERLAKFREKAASERNAPDFQMKMSSSPLSTPTAHKVADEFSEDGDNFSFSSPISQQVEEEISGPRSETVVEHNIRASRLPADFRKSFSPGLSPEQLFGADTLKMMDEANMQAAAVPRSVIASHKALKMMGVQEAEVQKPFSETVHQRVERMAKAQAKAGMAVGGSVAGIGSQVAEQSVLKRREAEIRAQERRRKEELRKEEARIRAEIEEENKHEKRETQLRNSQKLGELEAGRLSQSLKARADARKSGGAPKSRLTLFIQKTEDGEGQV
jgi:hypothetical protein